MSLDFSGNFIIQLYQDYCRLVSRRIAAASNRLLLQKDTCTITNSKELQTEFVRVEYGVEKAARAIESTEMPDEFAAMLRKGIG